MDRIVVLRQEDGCTLPVKVNHLTLRVAAGAVCYLRPKDESDA
jgi:hypothetical protein